MIINSARHLIDVALSEHYALRPEKQIAIGNLKTYLQPNDIVCFLPQQDLPQESILDFMGFRELSETRTGIAEGSMAIIGLFDFKGVVETLSLPLSESICASEPNAVAAKGITVFQGHVIEIETVKRATITQVFIQLDNMPYIAIQMNDIGCFFVLRRGKIIYTLPSKDTEQHLAALLKDKLLLEHTQVNLELIPSLNWKDLVFSDFLGSWAEVAKNQVIWLTLDDRPTLLKLKPLLGGLFKLEVLQERALLQMLERFKEQLIHCGNIVTLQQGAHTVGGFSCVLGHSKAMVHIKSRLSKVAPTQATVLLTGESGTGKTLIAKEIHQASHRSGKPFIVVNCAAIPASLIESELFGYDEGAFTGARKHGKPGFFELADGGTLFLDEIGEMPLQSQGRLLEVIQTGSFFSVGGTRKISVDVRVIAATNRSLSALVGEGAFRSDLYYRLNVFPIQLPALRDRMEDLPVIARRSLPHICKRLGLEAKHIGEAAMILLLKHPWPGNVRELENTLEKACILAEGNLIEPEHIETEAFRPGLGDDLKTQVEVFEKALIQEALRRWPRTEAAQRLGIGRTTLFDKIKRYGLEADDIDSKDDF